MRASDAGRWAIVVVSAAVAALSCKSAPPPLGEALVVVDTDAPVPGLVGRLRVDLYTEQGQWYASRDIARPGPADWPVSFSLFTPDEKAATVVVVRLRAYAEGKTRDYRGEQFAPRPDPAPPAEAAPSPPIVDVRLVTSDGADVTPRSEPQPALTLDRILRLRIEPGIRGRASVVLRGACFGTMADLDGRATCVDTENVRAAADTTALADDLTLPDPSTFVGTFGAAVPCTRAPRPASNGPDGTPLFDEEACVPGAAFVLGNAERFGLGARDGVPERVAVVGPMLVDRYEVTVGRWRDALRRGFVALKNDPTRSDKDPDCGYTAAVGPRELHAVGCVTWSTARSFCQFEGGDLPTEAQWEYMAQSSGRASKTAYPWGDELPSCDRAVFGRILGGNDTTDQCVDRGTGAQPVNAADREDGDWSIGARIVGLAGGVSEWTLDAFHGFGARCWAATSLVAPFCEGGPVHTYRGGSWGEAENAARSSVRNATGTGQSAANAVLAISPLLGLRCVRSGVQP